LQSALREQLKTTTGNEKRSTTNCAPRVSNLKFLNLKLKHQNGFDLHQIIQDEIPCEKIIETDSEIAFLDIMPCAAGHTLVIPKLEVERLEDLPAEQALSLMRTMQQVAKAVSTAFDGIDYNLILNNGLNAGQEIAHVHFHVLPRAKGSPGPFREHVQYAEGEMQEVGAKIRNCL